MRKRGRAGPHLPDRLTICWPRRRVPLPLLLVARIAECRFRPISSGTGRPVVRMFVAIIVRMVITTLVSAAIPPGVLPLIVSLIIIVVGILVGVGLILVSLCTSLALWATVLAQLNNLLEMREVIAVWVPLPGL